MSATEAPFRVADLIDEHIGAMESEGQRNSPIRVLEPGLINYGGRRTFYGKITTLKTLYHNLSMKKILEGEDGTGRVLVVDAGGSLKCALMGDSITKKAALKGWAGIVIYGCVRDGDTIKDFDIGVKALALNPQKPGKAEFGERDVPVTFCGATIQSGEYLYADEDGIIVSPHELAFPPSKAAKPT